MRRMWPVVALIVALAFPTFTFAQQATSGEIEIVVVDKDGGALPGATVSVTGPTGERAARTGAAGKASLRGLPAGTYRVKIQMASFSTIEFPDVAVNAGRKTLLPVTMIEGLVETIQVVSVSPLVDAGNMSVATTFKSDEAAGFLPIGRNFTDAVAFAPGVVSGLGTGDGNYSVGGSSGLENSYIIDGVNITDSGYGGVGTYSIVHGSLGTGVTTDFLEEVQIKTAGFEAEYGQALGGIISGTVKSGTNELQGAVRAFISPDSAAAYGKDAHLPTGAINVHDRGQEDYGISAGGPIAKDKAFWFAAYNPVSTTRTSYIEQIDNPILSLDPQAGTTYPDPDLFPGAFSSREVVRDRNNYAAKLHFMPTANQWFELTLFGDPSDGDGSSGIAAGTFVLAGDSNGDGILDPAASITPTGFSGGGVTSTIDYGADQQSLKYNGLFGEDWFVQAQISNRDNEFKEVSIANENRYRDRRLYLEWLISTLDGVQTLPQVGQPLAGGAGFIGPSKENTLDYALKVSKTFGDHEVKAGFEYFDLEYQQVSIYSGPTFTLPFPDGAGGIIPVETTSGALVDVRGGIPTCDECYYSTGNPYYRVVRARFGTPPGPTTGNETALFAQDTWTISDKFTLKLGLRTTSQELTGSEGFTLPLTRVNSTTFSSDPVTFTPGHYKFDTELSPRIGLSYDPWGDGRGKLFAHFARYFERVPADLAVRQFSNEVGTSNFNFSDPGLTRWNGTSISLQGLGQGTIAEGTKLPFVDEVVLGWNQMINQNLTLEVRGIYREQGRVLEDVQFGSIESIENYYYYVDVNDNGQPDADGDGDGFVDNIEIPFPEVCEPGSDPVTNPGSCYGVFGEYVMANPGENTGNNFGTPVREYKAMEVQLNRRLANNWRMVANYRWSRLRGNYEGLFRNDNGQSDPNITSIFDFPNSNIMRGQFNSGPLNSDRTHVMHILGTYVFDNGLELGGAMNWQSGTPRTALLAHPNYQNAGELPGQDPLYCLHDGTSWTLQSGTGDFLCSYTDAPRGSLGALPDIGTLDIHAGYTAKISDTRLKVTLDVFNLFNEQQPNAIDDAVEATATVPNANFNRILGYQEPRFIRVSASWTW